MGRAFHLGRYVRNSNYSLIFQLVWNVRFIQVDKSETTVSKFKFVIIFQAIHLCNLNSSRTTEILKLCEGAGAARLPRPPRSANKNSFIKSRCYSYGRVLIELDAAVQRVMCARSEWRLDSQKSLLEERNSYIFEWVKFGPSIFLAQYPVKIGFVSCKLSNRRNFC